MQSIERKQELRLIPGLLDGTRVREHGPRVVLQLLLGDAPEPHEQILGELGLEDLLRAFSERIGVASPATRRLRQTLDFLVKLGRLGPLR